MPKKLPFTLPKQILEAAYEQSLDGVRSSRQRVRESLSMQKKARDQYGNKELMPKFYLNDVVEVRKGFFDKRIESNIASNTPQHDAALSSEQDQQLRRGPIVGVDWKKRAVYVRDMYQKIMRHSSTSAITLLPIPMTAVQHIDPTTDKPTDIIFKPANWSAGECGRIRYSVESGSQIPYKFDKSGPNKDKTKGDWDTETAVASDRTFYLDDPFANPFPKELRM
ncbi:hypothetical protein MP228_009418 [Amoeboaphelidium protococcarum]|nr:hypothetical protein MP228_009418 [Amoeboaphelidium protococcarum]